MTEQRMIYGSYPEPFFLDAGSRERRLIELADNYVFRDIFTLGGIRKNDKIANLVKALALQIGSEVSYTEIGQMIGLNFNTVESYISLLEQAFVIFRLTPYATNERNTIKKSRKVYFWDTGIRNALINNFNPLELRNDAGALFENIFISEMLKERDSMGRKPKSYFWRNYQGKEIDFIIEEAGKTEFYECKLKDKNIIKKTNGFEAKIVTKDNYLDFLL